MNDIRALQDLRDALKVLADDEFATEDTADLPEWGGDFERGAMWAFAEAARLLSATLASVGRTEPAPEAGGIVTPGGITPGGMPACPECGRWGSNPGGLCVNDFHTPAPFTRYSGTAGSKVDAALGGDEPPANIGATCCGECPGDTCYVDAVTGA